MIQSKAQLRPSGKVDKASAFRWMKH